MMEPPGDEAIIAQRIFRRNVKVAWICAAIFYGACYAINVTQALVVQACTHSVFTRDKLPISWCEPWQTSWNVTSMEEEDHDDQEQPIDTPKVKDEELTSYVRGIMTAPLELSRIRGLVLADRQMALQSPRLQTTPLPDLLNQLADLIAQYQPEIDIFVDKLCLRMDDLDSFFSLFRRNLMIYRHYIDPRPDGSWLFSILTPFVDTLRLLNQYFDSTCFPPRQPASSIYREMLYQTSLFSARSTRALDSDLFTTKFVAASLTFTASARACLANLTASNALYKHDLAALRTKIETEQSIYWAFFQHIVGLTDLPPLAPWRLDRRAIDQADITANATVELLGQTTLFMRTITEKLAVLSERFAGLTVYDLYPRQVGDPSRIQDAMSVLEEYSLLIRGGSRANNVYGDLRRYGWVAQRRRIEGQFWGRERRAKVGRNGEDIVATADDDDDDGGVGRLAPRHKDEL